MYKDSARLGLLQIQPVRRSGWRQRRLRQVLHSIPHYFSELRELDSLREGLDWLYFKKPYLFKLRNFPVRVTVEFTNVSRPKKFVVGMSTTSFSRLTVSTPLRLNGSAKAATTRKYAKPLPPFETIAAQTHLRSPPCHSAQRIQLRSPRVPQGLAADRRYREIQLPHSPCAARRRGSRRCPLPRHPT